MIPPGSGVRTFAGTGYHGTSVSAVAAAAGISEGYVFRLFRDKQSLFVAALWQCFDRIREALEAGVGTASGPEAVLDAMATAYATLIAHRDLLMLQVHAVAAVNVTPIGAELRAAQGDLVEFVRTRSGASDEAVQEFFARGQLCHFVTALGLTDEADPPGWARLLTAGIRHFPPA